MGIVVGVLFKFKNSEFEFKMGHPGFVNSVLGRCFGGLIIS